MIQKIGIGVAKEWIVARMFRQSRLESAIEATLNVGSGFIIAMLLWQLVVAPLWGYEVTLLDNLGLTAIFTGVSLIRGYIWRRFFEWRIRKRVRSYER